MVLQLKGKLMESGGTRLALHCTMMMIKDSHPWVAAVTEVEMVRLGEAKVGSQLIHAVLTPLASLGPTFTVSIYLETI